VDLTDMHSTVTLLSGLAILAGILGVVVPGLPALPLCWGGVLAWAVFGGGGLVRWLVLSVVTLIALGAAVAKYSWPGRNLRNAGVPNRSLLMGGLLGLVGFFVVPVVGLFLGFVLGIWLAERVRLADPRLAWPSTKHALRAAGLSMLIELAGCLMIAVIWLLGLVAA